MESMLERMGYKVLSAENGNHAIEICKSADGPIDIAIMDLFLPDMRGDTICPKIQERHPGIKILVMSGYGLKDTTVLDTEVHGFIQKPCTYELLSEVLKALF